MKRIKFPLLKEIKFSLLVFMVLILCLPNSPGFAAASAEEPEMPQNCTSSAESVVTEPVIETAPMNPDFLESLEPYSIEPPSPVNDYGQISGTGYRPSPVNLQGLTGSQGRVLIGASDSELPAVYDLRKEGKVTTAKNQGKDGSCWAFSTVASLESYILGKEKESNDFSENNMKNLVTSNYPQGFDLTSDEGGNAFMSTAYLSRWNGPVYESEDPYNDSSAYSPGGLFEKKHVQEALFLPARTEPLDNEVLKSALLEYGAVYTTMYWNLGYYQEKNHTYRYTRTRPVNHAVTIVGWNDSFDRNSFTQVPPGDGAFIVKNSWGDTWGENGYFYISYYDTRLGYYENAVFTAENKDNYDHVYQYDPLGWVLSKQYPESLIAWGGNVFSSGRNETLRAIGLYTTDLNTAYEIYVYKNPVSGPVNFRQGFVAKENGRYSFPGYHTHMLSTGVPLRADEKFSIVIKFTNPSASGPLAVEQPVVYYSSRAQSNPGESYVSPNGIKWEDISGNAEANLCIKAFTTSTPFSIASASPESNITTYKGENQKFDISTNYVCNITWYLNGNEREGDSEFRVNNSSYSETIHCPGYYNVTAIARTGDEKVAQSWNWTVRTWNPWESPTSQDGEKISTRELQEAIHIYRNGLRAPETGAEITKERLKELILLWREGSKQ